MRRSTEVYKDFHAACLHLEQSVVSSRPRPVPKPDMVARAAIVTAMYQFAIDMGEENSYTPAAPKVVEAEDL